MDRSLDSALDSALAAINLSGGSSLSEDFRLSPSGNLRSASLNQVELSRRPLLSAEVTRALFCT